MYILLILLLFVKSSVLCLDAVAFMAIKGSRNDRYVSFQSLVVNNKADFNPMYGVFKCTSPGIYFFTFQAINQPNRELRISLRTNRVSVVTAYGSGPPSTISGSALLDLSVDDLVYLYLDRGEINESNQVNLSFTTFSGIQVSSKSSGILSTFIGRSKEDNDYEKTNKIIQKNQNKKINKH